MKTDPITIFSLMEAYTTANCNRHISVISKKMHGSARVLPWAKLIVYKFLIKLAHSRISVRVFLLNNFATREKVRPDLAMPLVISLFFRHLN